MRRSILPLILGLCGYAFAAAASPAPAGSNAEGGAIPIPPATADDVTADVAAWGPPNGGAAPASAADALSDDPGARGRYLADAGDCMTCHTTPGGAAYAGARPIRTPLGTIYSANITPDPTTGIGGWTEDEFYRSMHEGVGHGGKRLYSVFPYPYFTHMSRADVDALWAYLKTVTPVSQAKPANRLPFPLNIRFLLRIWNALFFTAGEFRPDPAKSAEWNRGAYLVQGPGHCGGCHTPKNFLEADENRKALQGGRLDNWVAVDLTGDSPQGLTGWDQADLVEYLRSGRNARATASGSMQEVIYYSTSRMNDTDLTAIATYLKDLPAKAPAVRPQPPDDATMRAGEAVYTDVCAACHKADGTGLPRLFPPLKGNAALQSNDPTTVVRIILEGSRSLPTPAKPTPLAMPAFGWKLDDGEIAAVASFVRNHWGNVAPLVSPGRVARLRHSLGHQSSG